MNYISSFFISPEKKSFSGKPSNYTDDRLENRLKNFQSIINYYNSSNFDKIPKSVLSKLIDHFNQISNPTFQQVILFFKENQMDQYYNYAFRVYRLFNDHIPILEEDQVDHLIEQFQEISWIFYSKDLEHSIGFSYLLQQLCLLNKYQLGEYIELNIYQADQKIPVYQEVWNQIINSDIPLLSQPK